MEEALRQQPSGTHPRRPTHPVLSSPSSSEPSTASPSQKSTSFSPSSIPQEQSRMGALDSQQKSKK